jgi:adenylate cyclase
MSSILSKGLQRLIQHYPARAWHVLAFKARLLERRLRLTKVPIAVKLALAISMLIIIGMGALGSIIVSNQSQLLQRNIDSLGHTVAKQTAESAKEMILAEDQLGLSVLANNLISDQVILGAVLTDFKGRVLSRAGVTPFAEEEQLDTGTGFFSIDKVSSYQWEWYDVVSDKQHAVTSYISPITFRNVQTGYAIITFDSSVMVQAIADSVRAITAATLLMIILAVILSFVMGRQLSRPIHHLMDASRAIGEGKYEYRINERRNDEIGYLINSFNQMAEGLLQKNQVENAFSKYLSPKVAKQVLNNLQEVKLGGKHVTGTVLFADIVDYTSISNRLTPQDTVELLNEYFSYIDQACKLYNGSIDKYMGDCAMAIFGIPEQDEEHVFNAISCGLLIQRMVNHVNRERVNNGKFPILFRIGINTGEMLAGNMGSQDRMQYTVVGDAVNLASRLCTFAGPGELAISSDIVDIAHVADRIIAEPNKNIQLRSRETPVKTFIVRGLAPGHSEQLDHLVEQLCSDRDVA